MVLGRLTHYAFDALAVSVVLAGVKKQTGFGYVPFPSLYATLNHHSLVPCILISRVEIDHWAQRPEEN